MINRIIQESSDLTLDSSTLDKIYKMSNLDFINKYKNEILLMIPLMDMLTSDMTAEIKQSSESIATLCVCALAISFNLEKEDYRMLLEDCRLNGSYKFLKKSVVTINILFKLFKLLSNDIDIKILSINDMLTFNVLFIPFILSVIKSVKAIDMKIDDFIKIRIPDDNINNDHIIKSIILNLVEFNKTNINKMDNIIAMMKNKYEDILDSTHQTHDIKKYSDFIKSSEIINEDDIAAEIDEINHNLNDRDKELEIKRVIGTYTDTSVNKDAVDVNVDINLRGAIKMLTPYDQSLLLRDIKAVLTESMKTDDVKTNVLGKGAFNAYIKVLNALGINDITPDISRCPDNFAIMYITDDINISDLIRLMSRFKSLDMLRKYLQSVSNDINISLYFGIVVESNNVKMQYGMIKDDKSLNVIGSFMLTNSVFKKIINNTSSNFMKSMKKELNVIDIKDVKKLMSVKHDLVSFDPGLHIERTNCIIKDNVLSVGFYGLGKWDNGKIDAHSYNEFKSAFKDWVLTKKWAKNVLLNIKPDKFWVKFNIKFK